MGKITVVYSVKRTGWSRVVYANEGIRSGMVMSNLKWNYGNGNK
jgi:hypothetical protein